MKKLARIYTLVLTFALALLSLVGCAERNRADQNADADFSKKGDVLVVYFTWSGHLRSMAHWIADEVGADYARILRKEEYPVGYNETADVAKKEKDGNIYPEINLSLSEEEMKRYKTVFVGFPVWWYDVPMPVMTFLKQANLQGKNVYAFFSHEGSSDGAGSLPTLEKLMQAKGAAFDKKIALSVRGSKVKDSEAVVREWVKGLNIPFRLSN